MGRPRKLTAEQENEVYRRLQEGEKPSVIAKDLGVSYHIVYAVKVREFPKAAPVVE